MHSEIHCADGSALTADVAAEVALLERQYREEKIDRLTFRRELSQLIAPCRRNNHPTVKPIGLTRYLASLLLPPDEYSPRRLLVPFCGVASEMAGAALAGWEDIVGVDSDPSHVAIANIRFAYWASQFQRELF